MARPLPWIGATPWGVVVSEVMLQQTPASRVVRYWEPFLARFPSPNDLVNAPISDVLEHWRGLGYPRRALRLREMARIVVETFDGQIPTSVETLRTLPGVGEYTAGAIASFAFGASEPVVDTNVGRVLARALVAQSLRPSDARRWARELLPTRDAPAFNQALLDLGAQWCRPRPRCEKCPIRRACAWHQRGGEDPARGSAFVSRSQSPYAGSDREKRGLVLRHVSHHPTTLDHLATSTGMARDDLERVVSSLVHDGFCDLAGEVVTWAR